MGQLRNSKHQLLPPPPNKAVGPRAQPRRAEMQPCSVEFVPESSLRVEMRLGHAAAGIKLISKRNS